MDARALLPKSWLPAHVATDLRVCAAPYERLGAIALNAANQRPPLGSVVYASGRSVLAVLEQLALAMLRWPWVAPCIGLPPSEYVAEEYAALRRPFGSRLAVIPVAAGREVLPRHIARAVAIRPQPSAGILAGWIVTRLQAQDLATPLLERLAHALGERSALPRSRSSYSRRFARHAPLRATDWERLATLVWTLHRVGRERSGAPAAPGPGIDHRVSGRTMNSYAIKYLGRTWGSASQCVGWEWVLEAALRKEVRDATSSG